MSSIGPQLPPHLRNKREEQSCASDSEDDAYGPALPPHLLKPKEPTAASSSEASSIPLNKNVQEKIDDSDSSDEEILVGPLPPGQDLSTYSNASEVEKRALKMKRKLLGKDEEDDREPQRESWMLELPELKRKNFGLGPRVFSRTDKPEITGRDDWTSTPGSEKNVSKEKDTKRKESLDRYLEEKRNKELEKIVQKHDKSKRSKSLLSIHQEDMKKKKKMEESKPKERKPFNRDEDLKANQLDDAKKKALIKRSQELNSKFGVGSQKFL